MLVYIIAEAPTMYFYNKSNKITYHLINDNYNNETEYKVWYFYISELEEPKDVKLDYNYLLGMENFDILNIDMTNNMLSIPEPYEYVMFITGLIIILIKRNKEC